MYIRGGMMNKTKFVPRKNLQDASDMFCRIAIKTLHCIALMALSAHN